MSQFKYISLYCCEKRDKTNNGSIKVRVDFTDIDDFKTQRRELLEKQKLLNAEYRKSNPPQVKKNRSSLFSPLKPDNRNENQNVGVNKVAHIPTIEGLPDLIMRHDLKNNYTSGGANNIAIFGSSGSGKTYIMKALYDKYFTDIPKQRKLHTVLFSPSSHADVYKSLPKQVVKINKFDKNSANLIQQMVSINQKNNNKYNWLVLLDDVTNVRYSEMVNQLFLVLRNSNVNSIVNLQYCKLLSKSARSSVHHTCFGAFSTSESIKGVLDCYLKDKFSSLGYHSEIVQIQLYRSLCRDHHFIYYNSASDTLIRFKLNLES